VGDAKRKLEAMTGLNLKAASEVKALRSSFKAKPLVPNTFDSWRQTALDNNPELRASAQAVEVARQEYEKQQAAHYPVLSGVATWGQQSSQNTATINQTALTTAVGVQLSMPFYSGGAIVGRSVQAYANYEKAQADRDATINKIMEIANFLVEFILLI
jgi:protease secretion system outer membrane protein